MPPSPDTHRGNYQGTILQDIISHPFIANDEGRRNDGAPVLRRHWLWGETLTSPPIFLPIATEGEERRIVVSRMGSSSRGAVEGSTLSWGESYPHQHGMGPLTSRRKRTCYRKPHYVSPPMRNHRLE